MKYTTAQKIFDSVANDYSAYDNEGMIDYFSLIKIIKWCNSELSLAINPEAEDVVTITNHKGKLPDNYEALNFALLCTRERREVTPVKGFQIEYKTTHTKKNPCSVCLEECDNEFKVIQRCDKEWVEFDQFDVVRLITNSVRGCTDNCMNLRSRSRNEIKIQGDYIHTNFSDGTVYINYITNMVDADGTLLVLDHPQVRFFYELACKLHILKNLYANNDDDVRQRIADVSRDLYIEQGKAIGFVCTPEFTEIAAMFRHNRANFNRKYVRPFDYGN